MTALTFTDTLSRVITSCGGTCSAVMRMSMMIIRSMNGTIHFRPAARTPAKRPRRSTTPCSYSLMIRMPERNQRMTRATGMASPMAGIFPPLRDRGCKRRVLGLLHRSVHLNGDDEPIDRRDLDPGPCRDLGGGTGLPVL